MTYVSVGDLVEHKPNMPSNWVDVGSVGLVISLVLEGRGVEVLTSLGKKTRWWSRHVEVLHESG